MSMEDDLDETLKKYEGSMEIVKKKMRKKLMNMTKQDRFRVLREDLSLKGIKAMCEWALPEEDFEICASVAEIVANNIDTFKLRFSFQGDNNNKALLVKFKGTDGRTYYHADYLLHDNDNGAVVMLHKNDSELWTSEWVSNDPNLFIPIGEAIDIWEKQKSYK